jgi:hypothetical protein
VSVVKLDNIRQRDGASGLVLGPGPFGSKRSWSWRADETAQLLATKTLLAQRGKKQLD